ncbi:MAG: hypothetical protein MHMPM18_004710, partial [Marteilia pararefringens]
MLLTYSATYPQLKIILEILAQISAMNPFFMSDIILEEKCYEKISLILKNYPNADNELTKNILVNFAALSLYPVGIKLLLKLNFIKSIIINKFLYSSNNSLYAWSCIIVGNILREAKILNLSEIDTLQSVCMTNLKNRDPIIRTVTCFLIRNVVEQYCNTTNLNSFLKYINARMNSITDDMCAMYRIELEMIETGFNDLFMACRNGEISDSKIFASLKNNSEYKVKI